MKITIRQLRNLIKEAKGVDSCPVATQDKELSDFNRGVAAQSRKVAYMHPEDAIKILELAEQGKLCGNCAAYDISPKMVACGGADEEGTYGYCKMHDFSCAAEKTCLTYAPGGPKI
jgi:hypothetical protein